MITNVHGDTNLGPSRSYSYSCKYEAVFGGGDALHYPDMTAIACAYTPEGFVVGADGLRTDARTGQEVTNDAQKIFPISHPNFRGIHAWAGSSWLFSLDGCPFIFSEEVQHLMKDSSRVAIDSVSDYVMNLGSGIYQRLLTFNCGAVIRDTKLASKNEIARGLFVGYVGSRAWRVQISFPYQNGLLLPPVLAEICENPPNFCIFSGSALSWRDLQPHVSEPQSLEEAAELVRTYIQFCADKRHEYGDCKNIGGHIHIAAITPEKTGWIDQPNQNFAS